MPTYKEQTDERNREKLATLLPSLPLFIHSYINHLGAKKSSSTAVAYAYDLIVFFTFIKDTNPMYKNIDLADLPAEQILSSLKPFDIEEYIQYLSSDTVKSEHNNRAAGIARKMSALRGLYKYCNKMEILRNNPTADIETKRIKKKRAVYMAKDEVRNLYNTVDNSIGFSESQKKKYLSKTLYRDKAIFMLLLNTGIRVSECVGLNIYDINLKENSIDVHRKGDKDATLYFSDDTKNALNTYIEDERPILLKNNDTTALFLSLQHKRMGVRAVQNLVKKFTENALNGKSLSPHKMRSTFATTLYKETGDINLVKDVLSHENIETTTRYINSEEENRRFAGTVDLY